jgi:hypothetical protein
MATAFSSSAVSTSELILICYTFNRRTRRQAQNPYIYIFVVRSLFRLTTKFTNYTKSELYSFLRLSAYSVVKKNYSDSSLRLRS